MHIFLLILKIIGIGLLAILGLLLVLILLLLFVPFCYRAEGSYYENKPYAIVRVRYLFPLLQVFVKYQEGELQGKAKLFGITVKNFFPSEEENETPQKKPKEKKRKKQSEPIVENGEIEQEEVKPAKMQTEDAPETQEAPEEKKQTLWEKIIYFFRTLKQKILAFVQKLKNIRDKGLAIKEKLTFYYEVWQREATQRAFKTAKKSLYKVWKSIRPRKGLVKFHFGTGDPGSTGQMCGYFGMLYPFVGKYVMIEPDFENKIYEGDFYFKGQITLFVFLRAAWTILFDKDIKELRNILMNS